MGVRSTSAGCYCRSKCRTWQISYWLLAKTSLYPMQENEHNPPRQKLKLSLDKSSHAQSNKAKEEADRWHFDTKEEETSISMKFVSQNIATSTKWALSTFTKWHSCRNDRLCDDKEKQVPGDIFKCSDSSVLCKWLVLLLLRHVKKMEVPTKNSRPPPYWPPVLHAYFKSSVPELPPYRQSRQSRVSFLAYSN